VRHSKNKGKGRAAEAEAESGLADADREDDFLPTKRKRYPLKRNDWEVQTEELCIIC
jgi:hypothetical protein